MTLDKIQGYQYHKSQVILGFPEYSLRKKSFQNTSYWNHEDDTRVIFQWWRKRSDYFCHHLSRHIRVTNTAVIVTFKSPTNVRGLITVCGEDSTDTYAPEIRKIFPNDGSCAVEIIGITFVSRRYYKHCVWKRTLPVYQMNICHYYITIHY